MFTKSNRRGGQKGRDEDPSVRISKNLSYLLRHGAVEEGLPIDKAGFVKIDDILKLKFYVVRRITADKVLEVVQNSEKNRYEVKTQLDQDGNAVIYVRALQGHTLKLVEDEELLDKVEEASEVSVCVHGTFTQYWGSIKQTGLKTMGRNHVHFANGYPGESQVISGMRTACNVYIELDVEKALKDGMEIFISKNGVILSSGFNGVIPPAYFKRVLMRRNGGLVEVDPSEYSGMNIEEETKASDNPSAKNMEGQAFRYLAVLDFEAQCTNEGKLNVQEIIEFPVVIVDVEKRQILEEKFHTYVKPTVHPQLFPFCTELTGIKQEQVDGGILLNEALENLDNFLRKQGVLEAGFCFVTCGHWDLNTCLKKEALAKGIQVNSYLKQWINLKTNYPVPQGVRTQNPDLVAMLKLSNLEMIGRHHSGIDDAVNIARVVEYLLQKGYKFQSSMVAQAEY